MGAEGAETPSIFQEILNNYLRDLRQYKITIDVQLPRLKLLPDRVSLFYLAFIFRYMQWFG